MAGNKHYSSSQSILLVGEGDFSFAVCLASAFRNATNIVATSLDSKGGVIRKYATGEMNLEILKYRNCSILHQVNARTMSDHHILRELRFDRIVFNFPHAGGVLVQHEREHYHSQIKRHRKLIRGFLKSAKALLSYRGQIHITHKTSYPFDQWNITELAEEAGLVLIDEAVFDKWDYPGYCNKKGDGHGSKCDRSFPIGACSTFIFRASTDYTNVFWDYSSSQWWSN